MKQWNALLWWLIAAAGALSLWSIAGATAPAMAAGPHHLQWFPPRRPLPAHYTH
ncbi:MAG: hypothetical protein OWS74_06535 [Firmicutes bacterium]|nr:hypothetical protein [Bacillota bacterium]